MSYRVELKKNSGYTWLYNEKCFVKGYAWVEGILYKDKSLLELLDNCKNFTQLLETAKMMNGIFSAVWKDKKNYYLISDSICTFPLFYSKKDRIITDDGYVLANNLNCPVYDELCIAETVASAAHGCGNRTWYQNIRQTIEGEILCLPKDGKDEEHIRYYRHVLYEENKKENMEGYFEEIDQVSDAVFRRMITVLDGRTAIIPLSGGCDSRYIAVMLYKLGYKNVVCYTYGKKNSFEVENSKRVAEVLNYPHFFVEYTQDLLNNYFSEDVWRYKEHATRLSNLVHVQDYIAVKELIKNPAFPKYGVMIPGHSGDMYGGTHDFNVDTGDVFLSDQVLSEAIYNKKYQNLKYEKNFKTFIQEDILTSLRSYGENVNNIRKFNSKNNCFDISNRQTQFICNSLRVYDFFGYSYLLPFYDHDLEKFWCGIPSQFRQIPSLYHTYLIKHLFREYGVYQSSDDAYFEGVRESIIIHKRQRWRKIIHWILEYMLLRYNINFRFWAPDVNNAATVQKRLYHDIKNKQIVSLQHSDFNNLWVIRDMEHLLQDKDVLGNILGR